MKPVNARMIWTRQASAYLSHKSWFELATKELAWSPRPTLGMRVAYMEALGGGLTVGELSGAERYKRDWHLIDEIQKLPRKKP